MGNSCTSGKNKSNKCKKDNNKSPKQDLDSSLELKKQADIISFQHKFPTIRPLLNNDLYKSRVTSTSSRKITLDSISAKQIGSNASRLQSKKSTSISNFSGHLQSARAVI